MANFNGSIDLMKLKGAKYLAGFDKDDPKRAYICIPVEKNEITVVNDSHSATGLRSSLKLGMYQTNENYVKACIEGKKQKGEDVTNYNPPSHMFETRYSKVFLDKLKEDAKKEVLAAHHEFNTPELQDEKRNQTLRNLMCNLTKIRLGSMHVRPNEMENATAQMASDVSPVTASVASAAPEGGNEPAPEDDLPF